MKTYTINSRALTTLIPDETPYLDKSKNYLFDLSYLAALSVQGDKALDFLQGQLTCDMHSLTDIHMVQGAQCNLKGRILALLDGVQWNGIQLILPRDLLEATQHSLMKTALLSRVSLNENVQFKLFGFYLQNPKDLCPKATFFPESIQGQTYNEHSCYYHLGNGFYIVLIKNEFVDSIVSEFEERQQLLGSLTWHIVRLMQGQVEIYPESRGLFLPHRLGLHETSYISFNKGCYKGQEIIARMHYKSTLKHDLKLFKAESSGKLFSGQKILDIEGNSELGELIDYAPLDTTNYLLAVSILKDAPHKVTLEGIEEAVELTGHYER